MFGKLSLDDRVSDCPYSTGVDLQPILEHYGDCLDLLPEIPEGRVDMVLCDLPYGVTQNAWDSVIPLDKLWEQWLRVAKKDCSFVLFGQGMFTAKLMMAMPSLWKYNLVWDKHLISDFLNANKRPLRIHEDIVIFQQGKPPYNPQMYTGQPLHTRFRIGFTKKENAPDHNQSVNYGHIAYMDNTRDGATDKYPVSIVSFQKPHPSAAVHPTEKPVNLLRYLIRTFTDEGATVLDSTIGRGSTGVAAVLERRKFIGMELDEGYFGLARRRIQERIRKCCHDYSEKSGTRRQENRRPHFHGTPVFLTGAPETLKKTLKTTGST